MEFVLSVGTQAHPDFSILEGRRNFQLFFVLELKLSAFKSLLEEIFFTAVGKPLRLSNPCFAVFTPNLGIKSVFKPVAINLYSSSVFHLLQVRLIVFGRARILSTSPHF